MTPFRSGGKHVPRGRSFVQHVLSPVYSPYIARRVQAKIGALKRAGMTHEQNKSCETGKEVKLRCDEVQHR